jgi:hypothetical protein
MNRYDDRYARSDVRGDSRHDRDRDEWRRNEGLRRDFGARGERPERESFHRGNLGFRESAREGGFQEGEYTGRTAGDDDSQPFSRDPYGYYPGQDRGRMSGSDDRFRDEWRGEGSRNERNEEYRGGERSRGESQYYGQREPYNAGASRREYSSGTGAFRPDYRSEGSPYGERQYGRSYGGSRYSESQYGSGRGDRDHYSEVGYGGDPRYSESGSGQYGAGYDRPEGWRRSQGGSRFGYGEGIDSRLGETGVFGRAPQRPFADTSESPGYFGTGNYADGGASPSGGFDQRSRLRNYGSLSRDPTSSSRGWGWDSGQQGRQQMRYRTGPKGYTRSDERLREDISERLMMADSIDSSEVMVTVKDGKVTLEGSVTTRHMKHEIEDLVDACPGVQDIDNRIRVERESASSRNETSGQGQRASGQSGSSNLSGSGQAGSSTSSIGSSTTGGTTGSTTAGGPGSTSRTRKE